MNLNRQHAFVPVLKSGIRPEVPRYAEKAGSGILDMIARCQQAGLRPPEFRQEGGQFIQTLWRPAPQVTPQDNTLESGAFQMLATALEISTAQVTPQVAAQVAKTLHAAGNASSRESLQDAMGMKDREHFRKTYLEPLLRAGWLERTIPDKPTSRLQKYRLTGKGHAWLAS